ncbi:MAG: hypothetical protein EOO15_09370 [Chitinophagaceae bacterium]|nr:MAG: hypothetical protein EOO15_09370 [Chitinophagaceae bacterium]
MIRVFSQQTSPRFAYVLHFLSGYFGEEWIWSPAPADADIHYGGTGGRVDITSCGLLFENGIRSFDVPVTTHPAHFKVLFPDNSAFGFDIFSGIFYLLSRYEEYLPHRKDIYGRYAHTESLAYRYGFLNEPLIHRWLAYLSEQIYGEEWIPPYRFLPTYDIDMAWSYRHKGFARNAGGLLRSMLRRDRKAGERLAVLLRGARDPFDCYDYLEELHQRLGLEPRYFIHAGLQRNEYDKNIPVQHPAMAALVSRLARKGVVGLHPSWASGDDAALLIQEKEALERSLGTHISASRQHFIRFTLPDTFRQLLAVGITDDYSMGYGTINGFRASVSVPFYWYDLLREEQTALRLHPFCFMDANAYYEEGKDVEAMELELFYYDEQHYSYGGNLITIFHNTMLGTSREFEGCARRYAFFAETITSPD